jgi:hypothetical protein
LTRPRYSHRQTGRGRARPAAAGPRGDGAGGPGHRRSAAPAPPLVLLLLRTPRRAHLRAPFAGALPPYLLRRRVVDPELRLAKLRASPCWRRRGDAISSATLAPLRQLRLLGDSSRVLCVAAGAGQAVDALRAAGVGDVTGIDLVEFPPLVRRADPHNLPFFDGAFDVVLSDDLWALAGALFPSRFAAEIERVVRRGGAIALAGDRSVDLSSVARLFNKSRVVEGRNVTLDGRAVSIVILRCNGTETRHH